LHDFSSKITGIRPLTDARTDDPLPLARRLLEERARGSAAAQRDRREQREPAEEPREPVSFRRAHPHFF
jgi:hypothetical protein